MELTPQKVISGVVALLVLGSAMPTAVEDIADTNSGNWSIGAQGLMGIADLVIVAGILIALIMLWRNR